MEFSGRSYEVGQKSFMAIKAKPTDFHFWKGLMKVKDNLFSLDHLAWGMANLDSGRISGSRVSLFRWFNLDSSIHSTWTDLLNDMVVTWYWCAYM